MLKLVKSWADRNVSVTLLLLSPSKSLTWHQLVKQAASQRGPGAGWELRPHLYSRCWLLLVSVL